MVLGPGGQDVYINMQQHGPTVKLEGSEARCPSCGNMGRIRDGFYDTVLGIVRESVRVLRTLTPEEAAALAKLLQQRKKDQVDDAAVIASTPATAKPWIQEYSRRLTRNFG
jgi:hypothetical protein